MRIINSKNHIRLKSITLLASLLLVSAVLAACGSASKDTSSNASDGNEAQAADDEVYTLRAATAQDHTMPMYAGFEIFSDVVEEKSDGRIKIEFVGGPESIPGFTQGQAIQNGSIDLSWIPNAYYSELVPEALVLNPSALTYEEEIERGSIEYLSQFHEEKMNAKLIGRAGYGQFGFFTKDKIESMEDFEGKNIRGHAAYAPLMTSLGASVISMPGEEIYGALERGMIDGFGWSNYGILDLAVQDLISYKITPPFNDMGINIVMNLDAWNKLPEDLQKIVKESAIESYYEQQKIVEEYTKSEEAELAKSGVEVIELEDGDEFVEAARKVTWEWVSERVENIEDFEEYFQK